MKLQDAHIVVIEDNPNSLKLLQKLLIDHIEVKSYYAQASGEMFFRWLNSEASTIPHLILLDIQLPREDGYTILNRIRQQAELRKTRVVAVTANIMKRDLDQLRSAGFDSLLGKPIRVSAFEDQLTRILNGEAIWDVR
jgi:two-component system, cell cycle response regulator DivK